MNKEQRNKYVMIYLNDTLNDKLTEASKILKKSKNAILKQYLITNKSFNLYLNNIIKNGK